MNRQIYLLRQYRLAFFIAVFVLGACTIIVLSLLINNFTPTGSLPYTAAGFAPLTPIAFTCNSTAFFLTIGDNSNKNITLLNASVIASSGVNGVGTSYDMNGTIGHNRFLVCTVLSPCTRTLRYLSSSTVVMPQSCNTSSKNYKASINVWYSQITNGAVTYNFTTGTLDKS